MCGAISILKYTIQQLYQKILLFFANERTAARVYPGCGCTYIVGLKVGGVFKSVLLCLFGQLVVTPIFTKTLIFNRFF